jgi:hypothetical protein
MSYSGWAIVELMGHNRVVGRVSEVVQYGVTQMQIDAIVPGEAELKTQYVGGAALFRMTPCSEAQARADWSVASYRAPQLTEHRSDDIEEEADFEEVGDGPDSEPAHEPRRGGPEHCERPCIECYGVEHHFSDPMTGIASEDPTHDAAKAGCEFWHKCKHCDAWLERT